MAGSLRPRKLPRSSTGTRDPANQTVCSGGMPLPSTLTVPMLPSGMFREFNWALTVSGASSRIASRRLDGSYARARRSRLLADHPERLGRRFVEAALLVVDAAARYFSSRRGAVNRFDAGGLPFPEAIGSDFNDVEGRRAQRLARIEDPNFRVAR